VYAPFHGFLDSDDPPEAVSLDAETERQHLDHVVEYFSFPRSRLFPLQLSYLLSREPFFFPGLYTPFTMDSLAFLFLGRDAFFSQPVPPLFSLSILARRRRAPFLLSKLCLLDGLFCIWSGNQLSFPFSSLA